VTETDSKNIQNMYNRNTKQNAIIVVIIIVVVIVVVVVVVVVVLIVVVVVIVIVVVAVVVGKRTDYVFCNFLPQYIDSLEGYDSDIQLRY